MVGGTVYVLMDVQCPLSHRAAMGTNDQFILWNMIKFSNVFDKTFRTGNEPWSSVMEIIIDVSWLFQ